MIENSSVFLRFAMDGPGVEVEGLREKYWVRKTVKKYKLPAPHHLLKIKSKSAIDFSRKIQLNFEFLPQNFVKNIKNALEQLLSIYDFRTYLELTASTEIRKDLHFYINILSEEQLAQHLKLKKNEIFFKNINPAVDLVIDPVSIVLLIATLRHYLSKCYETTRDFHHK